MKLSVVVTVVDGGRALVRCLEALQRQRDAPDMEVIVPCDDSVPAMTALTQQFPAFRFAALGTLPTARPISGPAGQHELFDRRRAAGLALASGDVVAIIEDRGAPAVDWARSLVAVHQRLPHAVIGGAIDNGHDALLAWAVYFCDFSRYQPPFVEGPRRYVSDVNIGYKRRALDSTASLWRDRYHETTVHWALQRGGETLYLTPEFVVEQYRDGLHLRSLIGERFAWGRLFAYTRAREMKAPIRLLTATLAPVLPIVLLFRHARLQLQKRRRLEFLRASPVVLLLLIAWSLGEVVGYVTVDP